MSTQIADANYVPDLDASRIPGALIGMTGFAPLQGGAYGSMSTNNVFATLGDDAVHCETFRQIDDTVRLLVFRKTTIDEYTSDGTQTERATGVSSSTTGWSAAAWGNYIYACNKVDPTKVLSTGPTFGVVGGDCPKARFAAANVNFVMLADTDDGVDDLPDQVWWCALQDPTDWTPAIATQAGKVRLLDAPGPIKQLVAFRDVFIAFKEDAIFIGEYVGPPFLFQWRMVTSRIGLVSSNAVVELDNALFFAHTSGVYRFDGTALQNIGLPVWQTIQNTVGYTVLQQPGTAGDIPSPGDGYDGTYISNLRMCGDDIDGVVWVSCYTTQTLTGQYAMHLYGYNARTGKWSSVGQASFGGVSLPIMVDTKHSDMREFLGAAMPPQARVWYLSNRASDAALRDLRYPDAWNTDLVGSVTTAAQGTLDRSTDALRVYTRCLPGSGASPFDTCTIYGYANEQRNVNAQSAVCSLNAELDAFDGRLSSRFKLASLSGSRAKWCILAGVGIEYPQGGAR